MAKKTGTSKKRVVKVEPVGQAHIHASFNNIIVTLTNNNGQVISWSSAAKTDFAVQRRIHHMPHRYLLRIVQKKLMILDYARSRFLLKDPDQGVNLLSEPFILRELR
jgi:hypothetical protein